MKTRALLNISREQYDSIVFKLYYDWVCNQHCSPEELQLRLISKPLQNYFKHQLNTVENEFKKDLKQTNLQDVDTIRQYYSMIVNRLQDNYPKALLKSIKQPQNKSYDKTANYQSN